MLYLIKDGKKLEETKSDTFFEIIDHIRTFTEIDCDWYCGEETILDFCENYSLKGLDEDGILESFGLKRADFNTGTVFEINCYDSMRSFKSPFDFINNAKAFAFKKDMDTSDYNKALFPFFGDSLKIDGTQEL